MRVGQRNKWVQVLYPTCRECKEKPALISKCKDGGTMHLCGDCLIKPPTGVKPRNAEVAGLLRELGLIP